MNFGGNILEDVQWLFFDVGATLVDESKVYEERMKIVAEAAKVPYEYVYQTALEFYKQNKKGDLEVMKLLNVKNPSGDMKTKHYIAKRKSV